MQVRYNFSEDEIKKILADNAVILVDTREQQNSHILDYFKSKKIKFESKKLDAGDYSIKITPNQELNIFREIYVPVVVEKKNSVDELASSISDRTRFENEFIRAFKSGTKVYLLVEDGNGYENILTGKYNSQYQSKAFIASLKAFESRYDFGTTFLDKKHSGSFIYLTLMYYLREYLKD